MIVEVAAGDAALSRNIVERGLLKALPVEKLLSAVDNLSLAAAYVDKYPLLVLIKYPLH